MARSPSPSALGRERYQQAMHSKISWNDWSSKDESPSRRVSPTRETRGDLAPPSLGQLGPLSFSGSPTPRSARASCPSPRSAQSERSGGSSRFFCTSPAGQPCASRATIGCPSTPASDLAVRAQAQTQTARNFIFDSAAPWLQTESSAFSLPQSSPQPLSSRSTSPGRLSGLPRSSPQPLSPRSTSPGRLSGRLSPPRELVEIPCWAPGPESPVQSPRSPRRAPSIDAVERPDLMFQKSPGAKGRRSAKEVQASRGLWRDLPSYSSCGRFLETTGLVKDVPAASTRSQSQLEALSPRSSSPRGSLKGTSPRGSFCIPEARRPEVTDKVTCPDDSASVSAMSGGFCFSPRFQKHWREVTDKIGNGSSSGVSPLAWASADWRSTNSEDLTSAKGERSSAFFAECPTDADNAAGARLTSKTKVFQPSFGNDEATDFSPRSVTAARHLYVEQMGTESPIKRDYQVEPLSRWSSEAAGDASLSTAASGKTGFSSPRSQKLSASPASAEAMRDCLQEASRSLSPRGGPRFKNILRDALANGGDTRNCQTQATNASPVTPAAIDFGSDVAILPPQVAPVVVPAWADLRVAPVEGVDATMAEKVREPLYALTLFKSNVHPERRRDFDSTFSTFQNDKSVRDVPKLNDSIHPVSPRKFASSPNTSQISGRSSLDRTRLKSPNTSPRSSINGSRRAKPTGRSSLGNKPALLKISS